MIDRRQGSLWKATSKNSEVFTLVARLESMRWLIALAAQNKWKKYAILNEVLEEEFCVEQPPEYEQEGHEDKVYKLKKALYWLKEATRAWNTSIDSYFLKTGLQKCPYEHALYMKQSKKGDVLFVSLYVDDLIFSENNPSMVEEFKESMVREFEMTDMGLMSYYLDIEVSQSDEGIFICQKK